MRTVAIIQARLGSTRLPRKVLAPIEGRTMVARVVERVRRAVRVDEVVVAIPDGESEAPLARECERLGVALARGSELDVLDRFHAAAHAARAEVVVRVTSDCPLIDADVIDDVVEAFRDRRVDYATNCLVRTFPRGLDTEVLSIAALDRAWRQAREPHERVHVTPFIWGHPEKFALAGVSADGDYSRHRWTVDTADDLELVRSVYANLPEPFGWRDVLDLVESTPAIARLNASVTQKSLLEM